LQEISFSPEFLVVTLNNRIPAIPTINQAIAQGQELSRFLGTDDDRFEIGDGCLL
jgi:hypothetical protein